MNSLIAGFDVNTGSAPSTSAYIQVDSSPTKIAELPTILRVDSGITAKISTYKVN